MRIGDLVRAKKGRHPKGVAGVVVDTMDRHPGTGREMFRVFFPGTAHRSDSFTDVHAMYTIDLEVINESR